MRTSPGRHGRRDDEHGAIAIVGAGCRLPGAVRELSALWRVLISGRDVVGTVPADRWDASFHDPDGKRPGTTSSHAGAFLTDVDRFDADFFGISPREARAMDPQQRLALEVAWEAMDDSGLPRPAWEGSGTGVFLGMLGMDYLTLHAKTLGVAGIDPYYASGKEFSFGAGRISYIFGLSGPAMTVSTACSSSLVALHLARQSLLAGDCDRALAGGVSLILAPELTVFLSKVGAISPSQRCRPFDAGADGIVRGEGCAVVVLRRLGDALADGDRVLGVIRGTAVNHDGDSAGLTVPSGPAQAAVVRRALAVAGIAPEQVGYVETHGTGTPLGDPIEIAALAEVFASSRPESRPLIVGSLKGNFGHLDATAGITGLLKALLVARTGQVPPQASLRTLNPLIDWAAARITVPVTALALPATGSPLVTSVSAFGLSGTNAHVVLSAPPEPDRPEPDRPGGTRTLLLSAPTVSGLRARAAQWREFLGEPDRELADVTAEAARRTHYEHRIAVTGQSREELAHTLAGYLEGEIAPDMAEAQAAPAPPPVVFAFSGQGSQWPGMGMDLYDAFPEVRETLDECDRTLAGHTGWSLLGHLRDGARLRDTEIAQPAVFALQVALARQWRSWGVRPDLVLGHSMGEVAAAHVSGALSLQDACALIARRGQVMAEASGSGAMVSADATADEVAPVLDELGGAVCVAAVNGPRSVVLAGPAGAIGAATRRLRDSGTRCAPLDVDYAFHSPAVRAHGDRLEELLAGLPAREPAAGMVSSVDPRARPPRLDAAYWGRNIREPVLFWPALDRVLAEGEAAIVEIGPHPTLLRPVRQALRHRSRRGPCVPSLVRGQPGETCLRRSLAALHVAGVRVDWEAAQPGGGRASLPPHPWQGERYWLPGVSRGQQAGEPSPAAAPPSLAAGPPLPEPASAPEARPSSGVGEAGGASGAERERIADTVGEILADVLGHAPGRRLPRGRGFFELGMDSVSAVEFSRRVDDSFGCTLGEAAAFDYPTVDALAGRLLAEAPGGPRPSPGGMSPAEPGSGQPAGPIAIVGMGCRLPGAASPAGLWTLLRAGTDTVGEIPPDRFDSAGLAVTRGSFLDHVDGFDTGFFRVSPKEARSIDPQQRLFLEVAWEALEDAGFPAETLSGSRAGVFAGLNTTDYQQILTRDAGNVDLYYGTGNSFSGAAGRLSYFLGLRGPSMAVDTACSSSLTAVHLACQSLRCGDCDIAVAGGANVIATPTVYLAMSAGGALSPDGRCKTFDESADGYGRGEGAGAIVLKPLSRALADGDRVHAVIGGSAVNSDGASGGFTVPSGLAQEEVIRDALGRAGLAAHEVDYVEAHGTGTALGDPIELRALASVFGEGRPDDRPLLVGSLKTNIGHLEAAAGIAGLIKVVLSMRHGEIPRHLHVNQLTGRVPWQRLPLRVPTRPLRWPRTGRPPAAGISAFGFTGTNAHVILLAPPPPQEPQARGPLVVTGSAADADTLRAVAGQLCDHVAATGPDGLADLCYTSRSRRTHWAHRLAVAGETRADLVSGLSAAAQGREAPGLFTGRAPADAPRRLTFAYGDAAGDLPWPEIARREPAFRTALEECDPVMRQTLGFSPLSALDRPAGPHRAALVFALQRAATASWLAHGVRPDATAGEGVGEITALHAAGLLSLQDAVTRLATPEPVSGTAATPEVEAGGGRIPVHLASLNGTSGLPGALTGDGDGAVLDVTAAGLGPGLADPSAGAGVVVTPSALPDGAGLFASGAAELHALGCAVDWAAFCPGPGRVVSLPPYPWRRRRHWAAGPGTPAPGAPGAPATSLAADGTTPPEPPLRSELSALPDGPRAERLLLALLRLVGEVLGAGDQDIGPDQGFFDLGMDSVLALNLRALIERELGCELPATLSFEFPNSRALSAYLLDTVFGENTAPDPTYLDEEDLIRQVDAVLGDARSLLREEMNR